MNYKQLYLRQCNPPACNCHTNRCVKCRATFCHLNTNSGAHPDPIWTPLSAKRREEAWKQQTRVSSPGERRETSRSDFFPLTGPSYCMRRLLAEVPEAAQRAGTAGDEAAQLDAGLQRSGALQLRRRPAEFADDGVLRFLQHVLHSRTLRTDWGPGGRQDWGRGGGERGRDGSRRQDIPPSSGGPLAVLWPWDGHAGLTAAAAAAGTGDKFGIRQRC